MSETFNTLLGLVPVLLTYLLSLIVLAVVLALVLDILQNQTLIPRNYPLIKRCLQVFSAFGNLSSLGVDTHNKLLQPRFSHINKTVEMIAHACGVKEVRALSRTHVRIVLDGGRSISMDELCPICSEGEKTT